MNILIVSFDKSLVKRLRDALKEYNVIEVKNGEEAINTVSSFIDIVIYDAVSGSISEEDINSMYKNKFKDSKYIVLVDDLFPVDMNNILPPKKVKLMRDEAVEKIRDAIMQEPGMGYEAQTEEAFDLQTQLEDINTSTIEGFKDIFGNVLEEPASQTTYEESLMLDKFAFEEVKEQQQIPSMSRGRKLLVVSFDTDIINNIKDALSSTVEVVEARNIREAMEKVKEADIILFDTISGMLAYRTLMDMSKHEELRQKPYVLLIDELFTIDVDSIPLEKKYTFARTAELSKAIQKVLELSREAPPETKMEIPAPSHEIEDITKELLESLIAHQEASPQESFARDLFEDITGEEPTFQETALQEEPFKEHFKEELVPEEKPQEVPLAQTVNIEDIANLLKEAIKDQLSEEKLYSVISQAVRYEDLKAHISGLIEKKMEEMLKAQIEEAFSRIDIAKIVREEAYKVLKERLKELIT
ncbi:MAG: hypothetical protein ACK4LT_03530 [Aquificaceae bacterium]